MRKTTAIHASLRKYASDDFDFKSSLHTIACVSRNHKYTPRSKTLKKVLFAVFVCFVTNAVHIEVVTSLSRETFLSVLTSFIANRGKPNIIYSDNRTKFQGAANELHKIYKIFQSTSQMATVPDFETTEGCEWNFIPPHGPHFGGLWEAAVKYTKEYLQRTLGSSVPTYEKLNTLLDEIEDCLTSRSFRALSVILSTHLI